MVCPGIVAVAGPLHTLAGTFFAAAGQEKEGPAHGGPTQDTAADCAAQRPLRTSPIRCSATCSARSMLPAMEPSV